ncbi:hypothetical protein EJB05_33699 [Eragrostis curvula]|uniref:RING-type E3 ubiquitin transferase n=1 Tax=Eragrostis curvula TaxID=38414 RepID=A0A5J9U3H8_9POAL|nr:hypothetical protein EJB05_33699 [Eragrostis curvula]
MVRRRNAESIPKQEPPTPRAVGTRKRASKRASTTTAAEDDEDIKPAKLPATSASRAGPKNRTAATKDVTLEDTDAHDCGICFLPLKPPIFQCNVGHVVCSPCLDKLKNPRKCHTSAGACHAMERLVESIHIPCPNSVYGCTAKLACHEQKLHQQTCMIRSLFSCPGKACGFIGSMETLLDHFASLHSWPCTTKMRQAKFESCKVSLRNGFNFLRTNLPSATDTTSNQFLFLINMAQLPDGAAISALCILSHAAISDGQGLRLKELKCDLSYRRYASHGAGGTQFVRHDQSTKFRVACTDFSNGLPDHDDWFQIVVPNFALGAGQMNAIEILFSFDI